MGRYSTGVYTTGECLQVKITAFNEAKILRSRFAEGKITWANGANIRFIVHSGPTGPFLILEYTHTDREGNKREVSTRVDIVWLPSNLGRGKIPYFICPESGNRCRVLYMGYGYQYFKCRKAYRHRIYYKSQLRSKIDRYNSGFFDLEDQIEGLKKKRKKTVYRNRPTKLSNRIERLKERKEYYDEMRWIIVPKSIKQMYLSAGLKSAEGLF